MRCKTVGCENLTRQPNRQECWKKYQKCRKCAVLEGLVPNKGYRYSDRGQPQRNSIISSLCTRGYHQGTCDYACKGSYCKCKCHDKEIR